MDYRVAASLLKAAMESPLVVDKLWQAKHNVPQNQESFNACLFLDEMLGGEGRPDSPAALEINENVNLYIDFLMDPISYPEELRKKAELTFKPFGRVPKWSLPAGFQRDSGLQALLERIFEKQIQAKLYLPGFIETALIIYRPSPTKMLYPWQQAIHSYKTCATLHLSKISSRYVQISGTKGYEICFRGAEIECARINLLLKPGLEQIFEFQTLLLEEKKYLFDDFISDLR